MKNIHKKYLKDPLFNKWVTSDEIEVNEYWLKWMEENPDLADEIKQQRDILRSLKFKKYNADQQFISKSWDRVAYLTNNKRREWKFKSFLKVAAAIVFLFTSVITIRHFIQESNFTIDSNSNRISLIEKQAEKGVKLTVQLPDGSRIKLNSGSKIIYPEVFSDDLREVQLFGEGYFEVAKESDRKFVVKTERLITTVLGTKFTINAYNKDHTQVALISGSVKVEETSEYGNGQEKSIYLKPGNKAVYENYSLNQQKIDNLIDLGWKDDIIAFRNNDINEILLKLESWYGVEFELYNEQKITKSFNGDYENEVLVNVLESIGHAMNFEYKIKDNKVFINGL